MVFVWSSLVRGHATYTVTQVAVNDLIMLVLYIPTVGLLIGATNLNPPWGTIALSVALFVVVPTVAAVVVRNLWLQTPQSLRAIESRLKPVSMGALVLTIVLIFIFQGRTIIKRAGAIALTVVPLSVQTVSVFGIAFALMYAFRVPHSLAAPGALIAASNFFELAVAVAMSAYGADSPATLATIVGVLVEVPLMLLLCWVANRARPAFHARAPPRRVLVMCTANRCRSILAEALFRLELGDNAHVEIASAGSRPAAAPHPLALQVLEEAGADVAGLRSKGVGDAELAADGWWDGRAIDVVVTLCAEEADACPIPPEGTKKVVHRGFADPDRPGLTADSATEEDLARFRGLRDEMAAWVREFRAQEGL